MANLTLEPVVDSIHWLARTVTVRAALPFALGRRTPIAGCTSAAALANVVLKALLWRKLKVVGAIILAGTFLGTGSTVASHGAFRDRLANRKPETKPSPDAQEPGLAENKQPLVDGNCDPLPEGASARLGTMRWRHDHGGSWFSASFSPDGKVAATWAINQRSVRLWNVADGKLLREIAAGEDRLWNPIFSADGKWLAGLADAMNRTLILMDVATGITRRLLITNDEGARFNAGRVAFSPDGKLLAVSTDDGDLYLFDFPSGRQLRKAPKAMAGATGMAFEADGKTLIALSLQHRKIYHWNTQTGAMTRVVDVVDLDTSRAGAFWRFSPDGTTLAFQPQSGD